MKKKVLFVATITGHITSFHIPYLKLFKELGYEVHVASKGDEYIEYCDKHFDLPFERFPIKLKNIKVYRELKKIIDENEYDIIHCHTPVGGVLTRWAARKARKNGTKVFYTAHGFHFYKGAPVFNWMVYYPIEWFLSRYTDTLILINQEDYKLAKNNFKKCRNIQYVPGVGIDKNKFNIEMSETEKYNLRKSLGIKEEEFVMIYPAELSKRKRQIWLINAISKLLEEHNDIHLLLPGRDSLNGECQKIINELNLNNQIHLLGYRNDIPKLLRISNIALSSSSQEGLPVNVMEAMFVGLPIVVSNCRGNKDLIQNEKNGYVIELNDSEKYKDCVEKIYKDKSLSEQFSKSNKILINDYLLDKIIEKMKKIYDINDVKEK